MRRVFSFFLLVFSTLFFCCDVGAKENDGIHYATLKNGMRVLLMKRDFQNIVSHSVFYDVGGLNDFFGKAGIAHFLEHLMFRSTKNQESGKLINFFDKNGVRYNAGTGFEFTVYYEVARKELLENLMQFESDRMMNLIVKDDEIAKERAIVKEERRMRVDDVPDEKFLEKMSELYYNNNSYGQSLIGSINDLNATENQDFRSFYKRYYNPKNAVLVIVGNVDFADTMRLVNKYYGELENRRSEDALSSGYRATDFNKNFLQGGLELRADSKNQNSNYYYLTVAPSFFHGMKDGVLADFLSYFIVHGDNMLYRKLVEEMKIALDVSVQYDAFSKDGAPFLIKITLANNGRLNQLKDFLDDFFRNIIHYSIDAKELERLKGLFIANKIYQDDNIEMVSMFYGRGLLSGLKISEIENYKRFIDGISARDVSHMISRVFNKNISMVGVLFGGKF